MKSHSCLMGGGHVITESSMQKHCKYRKFDVYLRHQHEGGGSAAEDLTLCLQAPVLKSAQTIVDILP